MKQQQSGFTLIEIAIVLVIIGLLLGTVLKGQELVNSSKVKSMIRDFQTTAALVYGYQDRFRALPGDDVAANTHVNGGVNADAANLGNGRINGAWNSDGATDESYLFWQHVRLANLASGSTVVGAADYPYRNADGGRVGITGVPVLTTEVFPGTFFVCSTGILGRHARQIDSTIDDGNTQTGNVRVIGQNEVATAANSTNVTAANDANLYTVCVSN